MGQVPREPDGHISGELLADSEGVLLDQEYYVYYDQNFGFKGISDLHGSVDH